MTVFVSTISFRDAIYRTTGEYKTSEVKNMRMEIRKKHKTSLLTTNFHLWTKLELRAGREQLEIRCP